MRVRVRGLGAVLIGVLVGVCLGTAFVSPEAGAVRRRAKATTTVVITTAPERRTSQASDRLRVLTVALAKRAGVSVTAPTCPAGVRTDRPTEYSCIVGFAGVIVAFYVREIDGVEQIQSSMPVIPTAVLNRAAGSGAVCSTARVVVVPVGTTVSCTVARRSSVDVVVTEELARPWTIDTAAPPVTTTTTTTASTTTAATTTSTTTATTTTAP